MAVGSLYRGTWKLLQLDLDRFNPDSRRWLSIKILDKVSPMIPTRCHNKASSTAGILDNQCHLTMICQWAIFTIGQDKGFSSPGLTVLNAHAHVSNRVAVLPTRSPFPFCSLSVRTSKTSPKIPNSTANHFDDLCAQHKMLHRWHVGFSEASWNVPSFHTCHFENLANMYKHVLPKSVLIFFCQKTWLNHPILGWYA